MENKVIPFTWEILDRLLARPENSFFQKSAEERCKQFKSVDPFPDISDSLLNNVDVAKYALATGLLEPFDPERLSSVTYAANFSGGVYYWSSEGQMRHLNKEEVGRIYHQSKLNYLSGNRHPAPRAGLHGSAFQSPRQNVYKGLFLGTGPIVDAGFVGKLFILLHNLTSHTYVSQKGAKLIEIKFTKLSWKDA